MQEWMWTDRRELTPFGVDLVRFGKTSPAAGRWVEC